MGIFPLLLYKAISRYQLFDQRNTRSKDRAFAMTNCSSYILINIKIYTSVRQHRIIQKKPVMENKYCDPTRVNIQRTSVGIPRNYSRNQPQTVFILSLIICSLKDPLFFLAFLFHLSFLLSCLIFGSIKVLSIL